MTRHALLPLCLLCCLALPLPAGAQDNSSAPARPAIESELLSAYAAGQPVFTLLDARSPDEFAGGHVAGAVNVPHDDLGAHLAVLPEDKSAPVLVYCRSGRRAGLLVSELAELGYTGARVLPSEQLDYGKDEITFITDGGH